MASAIANLVVRFDAATGPFNRKIGLMRRTLRGLGTMAAGLALALAPLSAGAMFVGAIRSGEDFNRSMQRSIAIMTDLKAGMRETMEKEAIRVAKITQFSAAEVARGYFYLASAGLSAEDSIKSLAVVAKFAQAGNFDLATATSLAADAQSAMGLRVGNTEKDLANLIRVTDVLTKANTLANATTEEFSRALTNKAAAAARIMGMEIEEVVSVLAVFANQGVKSVDAGTAFNIIMRDLTTKAIRFRKEFEQMGVVIFDTNGEFVGMANAIESITAKMKNMSAEQKKAMLLFLKFADKSISFTQVLLGTSDAMREFEEGLLKAAGTVDKVSSNQLTVIQKAMELLKGRVTETGKAFIDLNEHAIAKFLDVIGRTLPVVISTVGETVKWVAVLWLLTKAFYAPLAAIAVLTAAMKGLAIAQAWVLALSGGGLGLVKLAAVAAGAALAIYGIKKAMDATIKSFQEATPSLEGINDEFKRLIAKRDEMMEGTTKTPEILAQLDELTRRVAGLKKEWTELKKAQDAAMPKQSKTKPQPVFIVGPAGVMDMPRRPAQPTPPPAPPSAIEKAMTEDKGKTPSLFTGIEDLDLSPVVRQAEKMETALSAVLIFTEKLRAGGTLSIIQTDQLAEAQAFFNDLRDTPGILGDTAKAMDILIFKLNAYIAAAAKSEQGEAALQRVADQAGQRVAWFAGRLADLMQLVDSPGEWDAFKQKMTDSVVTPREEYEKFIETLKGLRQLFPGLITDAQALKLALDAGKILDTATGGIRQMTQEALAQLAILEEKSTKTKQIIAEARAAGVNRFVIATFELAMDALDDFNTKAKNIKLGEQLATQVETATEAAMRRVKEIEQLFRIGALRTSTDPTGATTRRRALQREADLLRGEDEDKRAPTGTRWAGAKEEGTQAAWSNIMQAIAQKNGTSTDRDISKTNRDIARTNRQMADGIQQMVDNPPVYTEVGH